MLANAALRTTSRRIIKRAASSQAFKQSGQNAKFIPAMAMTAATIGGAVLSVTNDENEAKNALCLEKAMETVAVDLACYTLPSHSGNGKAVQPIEVGGTSFAPTKNIIQQHDAGRESSILVAKGKSHLSYLFVSVCSSVLYLPHEAPNNAVLFENNIEDDIDGRNIPVSLEIHYHKPARAVDLQWATNKFIEDNLPCKQEAEEDNAGDAIDKKSTLADLPQRIQGQLLKFNELYQSVNYGDRYTLQYLPNIGVQLLLNNQLLGTVGVELDSNERMELAKLIYSVWFGGTAPFSQSMKDELLRPFNRTNRQ